MLTDCRLKIKNQSGTRTGIEPTSQLQPVPQPQQCWILKPLYHTGTSYVFFKIHLIEVQLTYKLYIYLLMQQQTYHFSSKHILHTYSEIISLTLALLQLVPLGLFSEFHQTSMISTHSITEVCLNLLQISTHPLAH